MTKMGGRRVSSCWAPALSGAGVFAAIAGFIMTGGHATTTYYAFGAVAAILVVAGLALSYLPAKTRDDGDL